MAMMPDTPTGVNVSPIQRMSRPAGIGPRPVVGRFLTYDFNSEWRHRTPGELLLAAEQFWCVPPQLQPLAFYRLTALACELGARLLAVAVADGEEAA